MHPLKRRRSEAAFSRTDLLATTSILILGGFVLAGCFPAITSKEKGRRIKSEHNLKQIGEAFKTFATDHAGHPPWLVSSKNGGAREVFENERQRQIWKTFAAVSNELENEPKLLVDPADV